MSAVTVGGQCEAADMGPLVTLGGTATLSLISTATLSLISTATVSLNSTATVLAVLTAVVGAALGYLFGRNRTSSYDERDVWEARAADQGAIQEGLSRLQDQLDGLQHQGVSWQSQLREQVEGVRQSTHLLERETRSLATALRKPHVRGRWGELHLRRAVELAGLVHHCDFDEQARLADGAQRPDLVVRLAGGRSVVVDAKVPLDAFLDATSADDPDEHDAHLRRHARQLKTHTDSLAGKSYWRSLDDTPEFVVLFVPSEAFLSAALDADPGLLEHAAERQVVLASPTTLIALLRTVALGWQQITLAERTREIHALGRDLHERLGVMGGHLDKLGRSLKTAVDSYNRTVGSLESRVLVSARQFTELGVTDSAIHSPSAVTDSPRPLTAIELLDAVAETRDELPELTNGAPVTDESDGTITAWRA